MVELPKENDTKERLSLAYVRAVAARCGCFVLAEEGAELAGIDATIQSVRQPRRMLCAQLKATTDPAPAGESVPYDLPVKNYDHLRRTDVTVPQILVVFHLPRDPGEWLKADANSLVLRHAAWWTDLYATKDTANKTTIRVTIPRDRLFNLDGLRHILEAMDKIAKGEKRRPLHEF